MSFFQSAVGTLQTFVIALGAGIGIWSHDDDSVMAFFLS